MINDLGESFWVVDFLAGLPSSSSDWNLINDLGCKNSNAFSRCLGFFGMRTCRQISLPDKERDVSLCPFDSLPKSIDKVSVNPQCRLTAKFHSTNLENLCPTERCMPFNLKGGWVKDYPQNHHLATPHKRKAKMLHKCHRRYTHHALFRYCSDVYPISPNSPSPMTS